MAIVKLDKSLWLALNENDCLDIENVLKKIHLIENFLWENVVENK